MSRVWCLWLLSRVTCHAVSGLRVAGSPDPPHFTPISHQEPEEPNTWLRRNRFGIRFQALTPLSSSATTLEPSPSWRPSDNNLGAWASSAILSVAPLGNLKHVNRVDNGCKSVVATSWCPWSDNFSPSDGRQIGLDGSHRCSKGKR